MVIKLLDDDYFDQEVDTVGCVGNSIMTASGDYFDFINPDPDTIHIEDISKALANLCRYTGHVDFYSVAEHSVQCCWLAQSLYPGSDELAFAALMHDAAEAYLNDIAKPLKVLLPEYQKIEQRVESVIEKKYGISDKYRKEVKRIDLMLLKAEKKKLFPNCKDEWGSLAGIEDYKFTRFDCVDSKSQFLYEFNHLTDKLEREVHGNRD